MIPIPNGYVAVDSAYELLRARHNAVEGILLFINPFNSTAEFMECSKVI